GAIEIGVVGDLDVDATIAAVARTLGALPPREPRPALEGLRHISRPAQPFTQAFTFSSAIPKGVVALYWPTADARDVHRTRRLSLLADVLSDRLRRKIRDELGDAYSPEAENASSEVYRDFGWMRSTLTVDPARAARIAEVAVALADDLATHGLTADELARAKLPALTFIRESARTNNYWLGAVVSRAQEDPAVLDRARSRLSDIEAVTTADLKALARDYLGAGRVFRVTILPGQK
ncbi:MAG: M16 family metallopeptidase, partial [Opitutales bacterium]